jgi:hypothetical protein
VFFVRHGGRSASDLITYEAKPGPFLYRAVDDQRQLRRNTVGISAAKLGNDGRGRYSGGLFAGPAPTATIPNAANSPHAALVNAHGPGDDVPVRSPLDNVSI